MGYGVIADTTPSTDHCAQWRRVHPNGERGAEQPHREQPRAAVQRRQRHGDDRGEEADVHGQHQLGHLDLNGEKKKNRTDNQPFIRTHYGGLFVAEA